MCGIVGYIGPRPAPDIVLHGLRRLEYRGYDSAGIAALEPAGHIAIRRDVGKLANLAARLQESPLHGKVAIGHTRWATHGAPTRNNAHPHLSMNGRVVLVHNGIVENYQQLRDELTSAGVSFRSDTDTEVIVQLVERHMAEGLPLAEAARRALHRLQGAGAVLLMSTAEPDRLIAARIGNAGGITLGLGHHEMFIASDIPAILDYTRRVVFLESHQMAIVTACGHLVMDLDGRPVLAAQHTIDWDPARAAKDPFQHFMQKEIHDQPQAIADTLRGRIDPHTPAVHLPEMNLSPNLVARLHKLHIVACGTSYYAGLIGKFMIESIARLPVEVEYASEFRYYDPIIDEHTAVLAITQSGETADTLAAAEQARDQGATLWAIVNAIGSQTMRLADGAVPMRAGPEIGVASTKAFTTSLVDLYLLACALGTLRGRLSPDGLRRHIDDLAHLPALATRALQQDAACRQLADHFHNAQNFLFLGRGINYPVALEGALKLKEISYIHAEGYPAGEMKHGPIALIDESMPVLAIATRDPLRDKMISQIRQAKARGGIVIALAGEDDDQIHHEADHAIFVPDSPPLLAPVINVIPLQLLSYHIAVRRDADVDQPRNLAKSVTVE